MLIGVLLGVAAGALWGLIYLAPLMVPEYNPILLALGRFVVYGLVSLPFLWIFRRELAKFTRRDFFDAFWMPMVGNIIFYALLTSSIRLSGAPLAGMLMATIPVLVAVVSNIRYAAHGRAAPWRRVVPPVMLIFGGLVFANWSEFELLTQTAGEEGFWEGAAGRSRRPRPYPWAGPPKGAAGEWYGCVSAREPYRASKVDIFWQCQLKLAENGKQLVYPFYIEGV